MTGSDGAQSLKIEILEWQTAPRFVNSEAETVSVDIARHQHQSRALLIQIREVIEELHLDDTKS